VKESDNVDRDDTARDIARGARRALRILVVEDEPLVSMFLESVIGDLGHVVCGCATSTAAALELARPAKCDLAFADVSLRTADDGADTAAALREQFGIPSIFVSGRARAELDERARRVAAIAILEKPYTQEDVARVLVVAMEEVP
jgi:CheY-like chemotaxis protein